MKSSELFEILHQKLSKEHFPNGFPEVAKNWHRIGFIKTDKNDIELSADFDFIYADKKPVIYNYNDEWTAKPVFRSMLEALYPRALVWGWPR